MREERLSVPFRSATFDTSQSRQSEKRLGVKPLLRTLASKMRNQQIDLALERV
jgi:hypothetical protein